MAAVIEAPRKMVEAVADLRLPSRANRRLQDLMDRNTDGTLRQAEKSELKELVPWNESLALIRAQALQVLGRRPE